MTVLGISSELSKTFLKLKKYPSSLKHLEIDSVLDREENLDFPIPFEHFVHLESLKLIFSENFSYSFLAQNVAQLAQLSNLQEINLTFTGDIIPQLDLGLKEIAQKKILKKLSLIFDDHIFIGEQTLKALQDFPQLTHLALRVSISDHKSLKVVAECFKNQKKLESLKLIIFKKLGFKSTDNLRDLCEQINSLEELRHLKLSFELPGFFFDKENIPSFIPHLHETLTKQIKLETLSLTCEQINSTQALLDLIHLLKDSNNPLKKLKMNFEDDFPDKQAQQSIINLIQNLDNIRVLKLPGLGIDSQSFLDQVTQGIIPLKWLREFKIGKIGKEITKSGYLEAIQAILNKRGLRKFQCDTPQSMFHNPRTGRINRSSQTIHLMDFAKNVIRNPSLENVELTKYSFDLNLTHGFYKWE